LNRGVAVLTSTIPFLILYLQHKGLVLAAIIIRRGKWQGVGFCFCPSFPQAFPFSKKPSSIPENYTGKDADSL
jgi:hypothetical protein